MLILTMLNPIRITDSYQFDFKVIPIIIGFFYGGTRVGIALIMILLCFHFSYSMHFLITMLNYSIASTIMIYLTKKLDALSLKGKLFLLACVYWFITITRVVYLLYSERIEQVYLLFFYVTLSTATIAIVVYIINYYDWQLDNQMQLQAAERLNTVSQLAASVAHEVRNPMTSVKGFLQLMRTDTNLSERQLKFMEISLGELSRTEDIINDYLSLAKPLTKEEHEYLNITSELKKIKDIMESYTYTHNIQIEATIEEGLVSLGRKNEFRQALINIMKNSVEAMQESGMLLIAAYKKSDKVYIKICDNGIGMTEKQVKQLGTPYYSTKDKGTGVGLTLTYRIIREMKGEIKVESHVGIGTTFLLILNYCQPE